MHSSIALLATAAGFAAAQSATTQPLSPVSNVKGVVFDRFFQIWLENTVRGLPCFVFASDSAPMSTPAIC